LRIIRVCRINGVLIRMGRLKSPYDPSLLLLLSNHASYLELLPVKYHCDFQERMGKVCSAAFNCVPPVRAPAFA